VALNRSTSGPTVDPTPHLRELLDETEQLTERCAAADPTARATLAADRLERAALASLRLDGSPIAGVPSPGAIEDARATVEAATLEDPRRGTWFDAMRAFEGVDPDDPEAVATDAAVHALEFDGVVAATTADDLAAELLVDPVTALGELHRRLTRHLVAPERAGQLRRVEQAVHDASVGRILYFTVDPERIAAELETVRGWLTEASAEQHGLLVSGLVHLELLRIHPFDAANGRLARAAARLVLRARGLDPHGLATPEPALDADRLGYHDEVARTVRRRDATIWLERWGEAVADGLRDAARTLGQLDAEVPADGERFLAGRVPGSAFTVADLRSELDLDRDTGRTLLRALLDAGRVDRTPGSHGLRFVVR
jgi:hypothetical protein